MAQTYHWPLLCHIILYVGRAYQHNCSAGTRDRPAAGVADAGGAAVHRFGKRA
jgi:hypothetical protein